MRNQLSHLPTEAVYELDIFDSFLKLQYNPEVWGFACLFLFSMVSRHYEYFTSSTKQSPGITLLLLMKTKKVKVNSEIRSVLSDSLQPHGLHSPWNSLDENTGVGSLSLLQGIFPTQGSNPGLLHCRWILYFSC